MQSPMTRPNRHRIQRQIVELIIGASAEGLAVHQELARPFWDRTVPDLEEVFDRAAGPDELLRLDRLELDLGTIGGGDWPAELRRRLVEELTRSLAGFTAVSEADEEGRTDPQPAEAWRQFLFFLAHGRLPWWAAKPVEPWNDVPTGSEARWSALRETALSDPRARSRLVYSVNDEFLERAIASWSGVLHAARVLGQLTPKRLGADARRRWRRGFWMLALDWVATGGFRAPRGGSQLVRDLMTLRHMYDSDSAEPRPFKRLPGDGREHGDRSRTVEDGDLPEPWRGWRLSQGDAAPFERAVTERSANTGEPKGRAPALSPPPAGAPEKARRDVDDEAIYLGGAGVILVHPFLEQLFRERGLLEGRSFRGLEARDRAVHLIGFITFGRVDVAEYELVLAKVLCGVELEEPLEPVQLEDDDVAACDALLRAVLEHWTALRSSSPDWLREQFFLREGKLERTDSGWLLTIERHAQDVLLARLPWGFGVVAPAWLSERIFVHWIE
jgi:hypothetical protein